VDARRCGEFIAWRSRLREAGTVKACFVEIDIGTMSMKGLLTDSLGTIVAQSSVPVLLATPRPSWVEQSSELWWASTVSVLDQLTIDRNCQIMEISVRSAERPAVHTVV
jgi:sugar (pentulose or hexulose) kinase